MYPASHNRSIYRGDTVRFDLTYSEGPEDSRVGKDLTGATLLGQIRQDRNGDVDAAFTFTLADQSVTPGKLTATLDSSPLSGEFKYDYDIQVTWPDGTVQTILQGRIFVTPDVTRA